MPRQGLSPADGADARVDGLPKPLVEDPNPGAFRRLLHAAYDLCWLVATVVAVPWLLWRTLRRPAFAKMVWQRLGAGLPHPPSAGKRRVLVHGVSVGEIKAAAPVVFGLEQDPTLEVVVSTTTETGTEVAHSLFPGRTIVRFPADISFVVGRFLRRVAPSSVVLIELEIWPNFLRVANQRGIPVAVVNGRITERSFAHYRFFRSLLPELTRISLFCVQDETYADRFRRLDVDPERVLVTGNIKADGLAIGRVDPGAELRRYLGPRPGQPVVVAGSTHEPEELMVLRAWRAGAPEARLVLVPRHPERAVQVVARLAAEGVRVQRLTELRQGLESPDPGCPVIVDTIGELERVYGLADLVFVGGSLIPHGGQNILEPAAQGVPVLVGPSVENFIHEAELLRSVGALREVADAEELGRALAELVADPELREQMSRAGLEAAHGQKGATGLTLAAFREACGT